MHSELARRVAGLAAVIAPVAGGSASDVVAVAVGQGDADDG